MGVQALRVCEAHRLTEVVVEGRKFFQWMQRDVGFQVGGPGLAMDLVAEHHGGSSIHAINN